MGYLNDCPAHWTQGRNLKELEEMLVDLYELERNTMSTRIPEPDLKSVFPAILT